MATTPYAVSINMGSTVTSNNYLTTPIFGPLSHQAPNTLPKHNYGTLTGLRPNPPQFNPSPAYADENTNARRVYVNVSAKHSASAALVSSLAEQATTSSASAKLPAENIAPTQYNLRGTNRKFPVSQHVNYIQPMSSTQRTELLKSVAVGKSSYKVGLPLNAPYSTKSFCPSSTRSSIRRVRSGGCAAPKKKGAIENTSLRNGMTCNWGSLPRAGY